MKKMLIGTIALLGIVVLTGCPSPAGDSGDGGGDSGETTPPEHWTHRETISATDQTISAFGDPVALDGDYAIIGDQLDGKEIYHSGAAYIFHRESDDSWIKIDKIKASNAGKDDRFGYSVDISGSHAIIGAYKADSYSGAVYVFSLNAQGHWKEEVIFNTPNPNIDFYEFGTSVAIDGDFAVVGARGGGAYVFERKSKGNWSRVKLTPKDSVVGDFFGKSVAISGNSVVVGSSDDGTKGAAYVFVRNSFGGWSQEDKLTADGAAAAGFGSATAIQGRTAIVSDPYYSDEVAKHRGAVYVYYRKDNGDWERKDKLLASDASENDYFGSRLDYDGKHLIVGTEGLYSHGNTAYIYSRNPDGKWRLEKILSASDTTGFFTSVAISGDVALVEGDDKAYIYY